MIVSYLGRVNTRSIENRAQYIVRDIACVATRGSVGARETADIADICAGMVAESAHHNVLFRRVERPTMHMVFSWHPNDRHRVPVLQQMKVADDGLAFLGLGGHSRILAAHANEPHPHVHALVSLMHPDTWRLATMDRYLRMRYWAMETNALYRFSMPTDGERTPSLATSAGKFVTLLGATPRIATLEDDLRAVDMSIVPMKSGLVFQQQEGWKGRVSSLPPQWKAALYQRAGMPLSDRTRKEIEAMAAEKVPSHIGTRFEEHIVIEGSDSPTIGV